MCCHKALSTGRSDGRHAVRHEMRSHAVTKPYQRAGLTDLVWVCAQWAHGHVTKPYQRAGLTDSTGARNVGLIRSVTKPYQRAGLTDSALGSVLRNTSEVTKPYQRAGLTDCAFWNPCPACLSGAEKVNGGKNRAKNASIIPRKILPVLFQSLAAG